MLTFTEKKEHLLNILLRAETLSPTEKLVAVAMVFKISDNGVVDLRMKEIAELSSLSVRGLRDVLNAFRPKRFLIPVTITQRRHTTLSCGDCYE